MADTDLYAILGVAREATQEEIKKAYRSLARRHHPDATGGSKSDEERFKQVTAAYEILSDPAKRRQYDMFGSGGPAGSPFADMGDIFDFFFGGGTTRRARRPPSRTHKGEALLAPVLLTFRDAVFGCTRDIEVEALVACDRCASSGCEPGTRPSRCRRCGGSGQVQDLQRSIFGTVMTASPCTVCEGTGEEIVSPCTACDGAGRVGSVRTVTVEVPAGVHEGLELRVPGAGHSGRAGGPAGDLLVRVAVEPHEVFQRDANDLFAELDVPMTQAVLGAELEVETLDGLEKLKLDPGTESGAVFRLRGRGVPHLGRRGRGDLFLTLRVRTPSGLEKEQKALVERLAELRGETTGKRTPSRATLRRPAR